MKTRKDVIVIALSGPDGTGKSSCSKYLMSHLHNRVETKKLWIKTTHTIAYTLVKILELINRKRVVRSTSGTIVTHSFAKYKKIWPLFELISIIIKLLLIKFYFYIKRGKVIYVADRFLFDTIVHLLIALGIHDVEKFLVFRILRSFLVKYSYTIWLDGDPRILIERKADKADPLMYMYYQRLLYYLVAKKLGFPFVRIDTTSNSLNTICKRVYDYIITILEGKQNED